MNQLYVLSDFELFNLFKSGNDKAFGEIYSRYFIKLVVFANSLVKDQDQAADLVQEIFSKVFEHPHNIDINSSEHLKRFLYKAVRYKIFNLIRHEKLKVNYLESIGNFMPSVSNRTEEDVHLNELIKIIDATIETMPPRMKEIYNLSRKQHLSHKEIAKLLNLTENTVSTQIQRAIKILRSNKEISTLLLILSFTYLPYEDQEQSKPYNFSSSHKSSRSIDISKQSIIIKHLAMRSNTGNKKLRI